jgi:hypothetical protein
MWARYGRTRRRKSRREGGAGGGKWEVGGTSRKWATTKSRGPHSSFSLSPPTLTHPTPALRHPHDNAEVRRPTTVRGSNTAVGQPTTTCAAQRRGTRLHDDDKTQTPRQGGPQRRGQPNAEVRDPMMTNTKVGQPTPTWVAQRRGTRSDDDDETRTPKYGDPQGRGQPNADVRHHTVTRGVEHRGRAAHNDVGSPTPTFDTTRRRGEANAVVGQPTMTGQLNTKVNRRVRPNNNVYGPTTAKR